jgi:choline dehydrogenase
LNSDRRNLQDVFCIRHFDNIADFTERARLNQKKLAAELKPHCDFIVGGAGSSGSVVAARLATDPQTQVLVLEAGRY